MIAPTRPTPTLSSAARGGGKGGGRWSRYSELAEADRRPVEAACREVTEALYEGLDLGAEIRTVAARGLGDTLLLFRGLPWGPASEAGEGWCFVKFGAVPPGPTAEGDFAGILDACAALTVEIGMPNLLAGVNLAREKAYRHMVSRGFHTEIRGVTMHRPNDWGYSRPGSMSSTTGVLAATTRFGRGGSAG